MVAINERGAALAAIGRYEDAWASFVKALTLQPQYAEAHVNAGKALSALKRYDEALVAYDKALALKPELVDAWIARGTVCMQRSGRSTPWRPTIARSRSDLEFGGRLAWPRQCLQSIE